MTENTEDTKPPKDDLIATYILEMLEAGKLYTFEDVAKDIFEGRKRPKDRPDGWRKYMTAVKQQAVHLARQGRIDIMRKGKIADPKTFKGIVKIRLPEKSS